MKFGIYSENSETKEPNDRYRLIDLAKDWKQINDALIQRQSLPYLEESQRVFLEWIRESIIKLNRSIDRQTEMV